MAKFILLATSGVQEGRQAEYDEWYDGEHIPHICSIPGVKSGRRFKVHTFSPTQASPPNLGLYEIETDDPGALLAEFGRRAQSGEMIISPALDGEGAGMTLYEEVTAS